MTTAGEVRVWHDDEGWGVVDSASTPGGGWTHFSHVAVPGVRRLQPGQPVELEWEAAQQDGYAFRAIRVWPRARAVPGSPGHGCFERVPEHLGHHVRRAATVCMISARFCRASS